MLGLKKILGSKPTGGNSKAVPQHELNERVRSRRALNDLSNSNNCYNNKNDNNNDTSHASGLNSRAQEFQQKFLWIKKNPNTRSSTAASAHNWHKDKQKHKHKNRNRNKNKHGNKNDAQVEVSEEYDIQSAISGLTRNSQFMEDAAEDNPPYNSYYHKKNISDKNSNSDNNLLNDSRSSKSWPDDEICGNSQVIRIATQSSGGKQLLKSISENNTNSKSKKNEQITTTARTTVPTSEPTGIRLESPLKENLSNSYSSKRSMIYPSQNNNSTTPGFEVVLTAPEPDGIKFGRVKTKIATEPSGKRVGAINRNRNRNRNGNLATQKSRGRGSDRIVSDSQKSVVEVVYTEKEDNDDYDGNANDDPVEPSLLEGRKTNTHTYPFAKRASWNKKYPWHKTSADKWAEYKSKDKDTDMDTRVTHTTITADTDTDVDTRTTQMDVDADMRATHIDVDTDTNPCLGNEKQRPRSLPHTLQRLTGRYLKNEAGAHQYKDESSSSRLNERINRDRSKFKANESSSKNTLASPLTASTDNVSSLGSQLEGVESQPRKRKEVENVPNKTSRSSFPPSSIKQPNGGKTEPRVCVEFSRRHSGGYFQTTCYESHDGTNTNTKYSKTKIKAAATQETNSIVDEESPVELLNSRRNTSKVRIPSSAKKPSRDLPLSCNGTEDSFADNGDLFGKKTRPAQVSDPPVTTTQFGQHSIPVTASPGNELCQESFCPKHSDTSETYRLSMTPTGRKDLIQKYLTLRDKTIKGESSVHSAISSSRDLERSMNSSFSSGSLLRATNKSIDYSQPYSLGKKGNRERKIGYDDASRFYQHAQSKQSLSSMAVAKQSGDLDLNISPTLSSTAQLHQRSRESRKSLSKNKSTRLGMDGAKITVKDCRDDIAKKEKRNMLSVRTGALPTNPSYSYCTDDDSSTESSLFAAIYRADPNKTYTPIQQLNYEDELSPHNQFMKMQLGLGR